MGHSPVLLASRMLGCPGGSASHPAPCRGGSRQRPRSWGPCTHVAELDEAPGFGLAQPGLLSLLSLCNDV